MAPIYLYNASDHTEHMHGISGMSGLALSPSLQLLRLSRLRLHVRLLIEGFEGFDLAAAWSTWIATYAAPLAPTLTRSIGRGSG